MMVRDERGFGFWKRRDGVYTSHYPHVLFLPTYSPDEWYVVCTDCLDTRKNVFKALQDYKGQQIFVDFSGYGHGGQWKVKVFFGAVYNDFQKMDTVFKGDTVEQEGDMWDVMQFAKREVQKIYDAH